MGNFSQEERIATFRKHAFEAFAAEGESISFRADFFLIFHAIAFEAFVAAHGFSALVVGFAGLGIAITWLMIGTRQKWIAGIAIKAATTGSIADVSDPALEFIIRMSQEREKYSRWPHVRSIPMFAVGIPALIALSWIALLCGSDKVGTIALCWRVTAIVGAFIFPFVTSGITAGINRADSKLAQQLVSADRASVSSDS